MWLIVISVLVGLGRFLVPGHNLSWAGTYEDLAHIWVGILLILIWQRCRQSKGWQRPTEGWTSAICLATITLLEVVMFMCR